MYSDDSYDSSEDPDYDPNESEDESEECDLDETSEEEDKEGEVENHTSPYIFPTWRDRSGTVRPSPPVQPAHPPLINREDTLQPQPRPSPVPRPAGPSNGGWKTTRVLNFMNRSPPVAVTPPGPAVSQPPRQAGTPSGTASPSEFRPFRVNESGKWKVTSEIDLSSRSTPATQPTAGNPRHPGTGTAAVAQAGLFRRNNGQAAAANRPRQQGGGNQSAPQWAFRN
jgi:hypothetical protein